MTQPERNADGELEDPGRDPIGLDPPRNPLGGADQDTGRGTPRGDDADAAAGDDVGAGGAAEP
ncbi:hypothetical protein [Modestobacter sp. I12A-02662]|uniref:hypothetical protein n=1 Tax=Modestobacter sp. I12A-02662 TaxID=1730496 RepID=UPI0034DFBBC4